MRREEKDSIIDGLQHELTESNHFYLADISGLNAEDTSTLRRKCFEQDVKLLVVKNTLLRKALEKVEGDYEPFYDILVDSTSVMFCDTGNLPAKLIKEFRKGHEKPILKGAYVEQSIYLGDNQLDILSSLKSKNELIGDVLSLLQSPMKSVLSGLASSGSKLAGALETLSKKEL